jgi:hypothetical protein
MLMATATASEAATVFESRAHVFVRIPDGFSAVEPGSSTAAVKSSQFVDQVDGITIAIVEPPGSNTRGALAELPATSGPVPQALARSFLEGLLEPAPGKPERLNPVMVPLQFDAERKVSGIEVQSTVLSFAEALLAQGPESQDWRDVEKSGASPRMVRCLVSGIVKGSAADPATATQTAAACKTTEKTVRAYIEAVTPEFFSRRRVVERFMQVTTMKGVTLIKLDADEKSRSALERIWVDVWSHLAINADAAVPAGTSTGASPSDAYVFGALIGALIGSLIRGSLFAYILVRVGVRPFLAAVTAQIAFAVLAVMFGSGSTSSRGGALVLGTLLMFPFILNRARKWSTARSAARPAGTADR